MSYCLIQIKLINILKLSVNMVTVGGYNLNLFLVRQETLGTQTRRHCKVYRLWR